MALTLCPSCGAPAELVDSRRIGVDLVPGHGWLDVTERRIACSCVETGLVYVVQRVDLLCGTSRKRRVSRGRNCVAKV